MRSANDETNENGSRPAASERASFLGFAPGTVAVVTGAGSGIGRATTELLLANGVTVAGWDIVADGLDELAEQAADEGPAFRGYLVDVTNPDSVADAFAAVARDLGSVGALVNNAGPPSWTEFTFSNGVAAALGSMQCVTSAWLDTPGAANGSLVNVASVSGAFLGFSPSDWYAAAKAGIVGYTRNLAHDRPSGIRANAVAPGVTSTPRTQAMLASDVGIDIVQRNPMGRVGEARDVASAIVFLLAPASSYINGVVIPVDGGNLLTQ